MKHDPTEKWRRHRRPYYLLDAPDLDAEAKVLRLMKHMEKAHRDRQEANKPRPA